MSTGEADAPQVVISTTPKPLPHVKRLVGRGRLQEKAHREGGEPPRVVLTRGHMRENDANLSMAAREELEEEYAGTRLGRQELSGELLEDVEGALWRDGMSWGALVVLAELVFLAAERGRPVLGSLGGGCGDEVPMDAAARELEEKTGLVPGRLRMLGVIDPLPATTSCPYIPGPGDGVEARTRPS